MVYLLPILSLRENDIQAADWFYTHHSLFFSYPDYQNVDRHSTDYFPVYTVLIVGL